MSKLTWAPAAFRRLNGVFCVYKPVGLPCFMVRDLINSYLVRDLNALPCYEYERQLQEEQGTLFNTSQPVPTNVPENLKDLSDHRLVLGERYIPSDIKLKFLHGLDKHSSGVLVMNVGKHDDDFHMVALAKYLRVYHVKGRFGLATHNCSPAGKIIERTTYRNRNFNPTGICDEGDGLVAVLLALSTERKKTVWTWNILQDHITQGKLDKACSAAQSGNQRVMFENAGVQPNSQEAYEMACQGIIRPQDNDSPPVLYGVKCIEFTPPDFTLEIHTINEKTPLLKRFIHDLGMRLRSTAVCTHIHRVRYGHFTLQHALLRQQWSLNDILVNIAQCKKLLTPRKLFTNMTVTPQKDLVEDSEDQGAEQMIRNMLKNKQPD